MNIAIDIRSLMTNNLTGVGEYTLELLKELLKNDSTNHYYLFYNSASNVADNVPKFEGTNINYIHTHVPNKLLNFCLTVFKYPKLDKWIARKFQLPPIDLFFFPNISFQSVSCPYIITAHDLSYESFPEFLSLKRKLWHSVINPRKQFKNAKHIIAVSENTAKDLINQYHISPDKISTIYSGVNKKYQQLDIATEQCQTIKQKYHLPDKFILYLGTIEPRKNIETLIDAFLELKKQPQFDYQLVLAGPLGWKTKQILQKAKSSRDIIFTDFIATEDKPYFYNLASIFVYPSYYEGFGFPPLEAMASGLPVITAPNSALTEVSGDSALYVDPHNKLSLRAGILQMLDPEISAYYRQKGLAEAEKFTWAKTAEETKKLFQ